MVKCPKVLSIAFYIMVIKWGYPLNTRAVVTEIVKTSLLVVLPFCPIVYRKMTQISNAVLVSLSKKKKYFS